MVEEQAKRKTVAQKEAKVKKEDFATVKSEQVTLKDHSLKQQPTKV